jgi:hypothetical protein
MDDDSEGFWLIVAIIAMVIYAGYTLGPLFAVFCIALVLGQIYWSGRRR